MTATLTRTTGRGALVNLGFAVLVQGLAITQAVIVPRLIGPEDVGLFALAMGGVAIGTTLKELGIPQKLVQEREVDLQTSYRVAFTLELLLAGVFLVVVLAAAPVLAVAYDRPELWVLTSVLGASVFTVAFLDLPAAIPYREMDFVRYNAIIAIGPVVGFAVTVPLAFAGWGVWSLAAGSLAGFAVAALVLLLSGRIRPALLWDRDLVRRYVRFGGPIWLGQLLAVAAGWGSVVAVSSTIGVAGLGYFQLAQSWAARALQIDGVLSNTVFPALCSIQSSVDRLRRAFVITNRLSTLWAAPVGLGIALFAEPVVELLLGADWRPAVLLVQAQGLGVVVTSIGYNWHLFFAARGETRPQLMVSLLGVAWLVVVVIPALLLFELDGAAGSIVVLAVGAYVVRERYLRRVFGPLRMLLVVWRELAAAVAAAGVVLLVRTTWWSIDDVPGLLAQGALYLTVVAGAGAWSTGALIRSVLPQLRGAAPVEGDAQDVPSAGEGVRRWATPRPVAFPLAVGFDAAVPEGAVWATARDWPALGRLDVATERWRWTELPVFPHVPSPDGAGGCWTALTRSSALAHVDAAGTVTLVDVPRSRELLVTAVAGGAVWLVDAERRRLVRVAADELHEVDVSALARPDFVVPGSDGRLWVADTHSPQLAVVDGATMSTTLVGGPHPTRFLVADPRGRGMWLGASDRPQLTLIDDEGGQLDVVELAAIPFGVASDGVGAVGVAVRDADHVVVVDVSEPNAAAHDPLRLPPGSAPMGLSFGAGRWWVACSLTSEVLALDAVGAAGQASSASV